MCALFTAKIHSLFLPERKLLFRDGNRNDLLNIECVAGDDDDDDRGSKRGEKNDEVK